MKKKRKRMLVIVFFCETVLSEGNTSRKCLRKPRVIGVFVFGPCAFFIVPKTIPYPTSPMIRGYWNYIYRYPTLTILYEVI